MKGRFHKQSTLTAIALCQSQRAASAATSINVIIF